MPSVSTRSSAGRHCSIRARTRPPFPRGSSPVFACRGSEARAFRERSGPPPPRGVSGALRVLLRLRGAQPVHEQAPQQRQPSRRDERAVKEAPTRRAREESGRYLQSVTSATKAPLRFPLLDEPLRPHPGARVGRLALQRDRRNASLTVPLSLLRNGSAQRVSASLSLGSAQSLGLSASLALILREFEEDESGVAHLDRQDDAVEHAVAVEPAALRVS